MYSEKLRRGFREEWNIGTFRKSFDAPGFTIHANAAIL
jgi:hypothetical protein